MTVTVLALSVPLLSPMIRHAALSPAPLTLLFLNTMFLPTQLNMQARIPYREPVPERAARVIVLYSTRMSSITSVTAFRSMSIAPGISGRAMFVNVLWCTWTFVPDVTLTPLRLSLAAVNVQSRTSMVCPVFPPEPTLMYTPSPMML